MIPWPGGVSHGVALVALALQAAAPAQQKPSAPAAPTLGTGVIMGRVVDSTGTPVSMAVVSLSGVALPSSYPLRVYTTPEGRFVFTDLPKGTFQINASKSGHAPGAAGRRRPNGVAQPIELADDGRMSNLQITIWKHASLSGTLLDDAGEPLVGATLWTLQKNFSTGRPKFSDGPSATTDDRGMYRVSGLMPGEYAICVIATQSTMPAAVLEGFANARSTGTSAEYQRRYESPAIGFTARIPTAGIRVGDAILHTVGPYTGAVIPPSPGDDGQIWSFQTTCYPNSIGLAQAEVITIAAGEERTGADFRLRLAPGVTIEGTVVGPDGPIAHAGVRLAGDFATSLSYEPTWESALTISDTSGRFTFLGVPAGNYILRAVKGPPQPGPSGPEPPPISADPTLTLNMPLAVGTEGISNLTVRLVPGHRVTGRVLFEGTAKPLTDLPSRLSVTLAPADGHTLGLPLSGRVNADGTFLTPEIPTGRYFVRAQLFGSALPWMFKSAMSGGIDVSTTALELQSSTSGVTIVFTDSPSELSGVVRDESGRPDPAASVVVFPADRTRWTNFGDSPRMSQYQRPTSQGVFRFRSLPPGQYFIAAIDEGSMPDLRDPSFLETVSRNAVRIVLADGEKKTHDVVVRPVK